MIGLAFVVSLLGAVALGAQLGRRLGFAAIAVRLVAMATAGFAGTAATRYSWQSDVVDGEGLWLPMSIGVGASTAAYIATVCVLRRAIRARIAAHPRLERVGGSTLGGTIGLYSCSVIWLVSPIIIAEQANGARGQESHSTDPIARVVHATHHDLTSHLPGLATLSAEADALFFIVRQAPTQRALLADSDLFDGFHDLPILERALEDEELERQFAALGNGEYTALFRLMQNPKVLELCRDDGMRSLVKELRPTILADRLRSLLETADGPGLDAKAPILSH